MHNIQWYFSAHLNHLYDTVTTNLPKTYWSDCSTLIFGTQCCFFHCYASWCDLVSRLAFDDDFVINSISKIGVLKTIEAHHRWPYSMLGKNCRY